MRTQGFKLASIAVAAVIAVLSLGFHLLPGRWIEILDHAGIVLGWAAVCLSGGAAAMLILDPQRWRQRLQAFLQTSYHPNQQLDPDQMQQWLKGVVIPVSRYEQPAWILHHLKPAAAALVFTERSRAVAERLQQEFKDQVTFLNEPLDQATAAPLLLERPHDPSEARDLARFFISKLEAQGYAAHSLAVDTTGGTAPMSLGLFQAAVEKGVRALYVVGRETREDGALVIQNPERREAGTPILVSGQEGAEQG